jgi:hypothetical protein
MRNESDERLCCGEPPGFWLRKPPESAFCVRTGFRNVKESFVPAEPVEAAVYGFDKLVVFVRTDLNRGADYPDGLTRCQPVSILVRVPASRGAQIQSGALINPGFLSIPSTAFQ